MHLSEINRPTDPILSQEEADGIREGIERRKQIPPADLPPIFEEIMILDEARLMAWEQAQERRR